MGRGSVRILWSSVDRLRRTLRMQLAVFDVVEIPALVLMLMGVIGFVCPGVRSAEIFKELT